VPTRNLPTQRARLFDGKERWMLDRPMRHANSVEKRE
jgi:hypothetical protein